MKKAVIMAGGFGTRLRPLTMAIPKPMVPVANIPMMEHIVYLLKRHGITEIVCVLYFQPEKITSHFEDGSRFGVKMEYVTAVADYGTAGAVRNAYDHLRERFIIISGDVLTDFDISAALDFHEQKKSEATILLTRVPNPLAFGIVMTDGEGKITRFLEKPSWGEVFSDTINTGIYILEPEVLDMIPYQREFDFSKDLYPTMLRENRPLYGYVAPGYWRDIGNLNEYQTAHHDVLQGKVQVEVRGRKEGNVYIGNNAKVAPDARLSGMVLVGENSEIESGAEIENAVIGNNVTIGKGACIRGSVIWDHVTIGDQASLTDDVICNDTVIENKATIAENVFIAEQCRIGESAELFSNIKLWPRKHVESYATLSRSLVQEEKWLRELFTDSRITGISNIEMNPEFAAKLGAALGNAFGQNAVVVASRDADQVSRILKRSITAGLMSTGVHISDLQMTSIPQTRQELRSGKYAAGFHVRKSTRDNTKTDIILFGGDGRDLPLAKTKAIERFFFGEDIKRVDYSEVGTLSFPERTNEMYINRYLQTLQVDRIAERNFKIGIDFSYGLASSIFPHILGRLQTRALAMNNYIDSSRHSALYGDLSNREISNVIRSLGYEVGFQIDPGAERISLIDERGYRYSAARLLSIVTKLFLEANRHREPYTIAIPILATNEVEEIAKDYNVKITRIKNSHSAMMEATKGDDTILFVGGTRGGLIFPEFLFASDGMYSVGKILEMLAVTNLKISDLDQQLPKRYQQQAMVACPWEVKGMVMRRAMEFSEGLDRQLIDGVKIFKDNTSVLLLPDKERGSFIVLAESDKENEARQLAEEYSHHVAEWRDGK